MSIATIQDIRHSGMQSRGIILQLATEIESFMDVFIAEHFAERLETIDEFVILILTPAVNLKTKGEIFMYLLNKKARAFLEERPILNKTEYLINKRNIFAHWPTDYTARGIDNFVNRKVVSYIKLKLHGKKKPTTEAVLNDVYEEFTEAKINEVVKEFEEYHAAIQRLVLS